MTVYLAAALTFGFYLSAVPVKFALMLRVSGKPAFGAGTAIFEGSYALKKARRRAGGEKKHLPWGSIGKKLEKGAVAARIARKIMKNMRLEALHARGKIGLPDAAQTAIACGMVRGLEGALDARFGPGAVRFAVDPDFSGGGSDVAIWGMFSISAGHIILGALNGAWETISDVISRRILEWTGTPLKIS